MKRRLRRLARTPQTDLLADVDVQGIIKKVAPHLLNVKHWEKIHNTTHAWDGTIGQFGYQKTNNDAIDVPIIYMTEVHVFKSLDKRGLYCAAIITVQVNERTRTASIKPDNVEIKRGQNVQVGSDVFDTTLTLPNGNVVKFGGWEKLDDVVAARNAELVEQGKFTQEQIDEMMATDGYVYPL